MIVREAEFVEKYRPEETYIKFRPYGDEKFYEVTHEVMVEGLKKFLQIKFEQQPEFRYESWMENAPDADDADYIVQLGLFGELVYS